MRQYLSIALATVIIAPFAFGNENLPLLSPNGQDVTLTVLEAPQDETPEEPSFVRLTVFYTDGEGTEINKRSRLFPFGEQVSFVIPATARGVQVEGGMEDRLGAEVAFFEDLDSRVFEESNEVTDNPRITWRLHGPVWFPTADREVQ